MTEEARKIPLRKRDSILSSFVSIWLWLGKYFGGNSTGVRNWLTIAGLGLLGIVLLGVFSPFLLPTVISGLTLVSLLVTLSCSMGALVCAAVGFFRWRNRWITQRFSQGKEAKGYWLPLFLKPLNWVENNPFNAFLIFSIVLSAIFLTPLITMPIALLVGLAGLLVVDISCRVGNVIFSKIAPNQQYGDPDEPSLLPYNTNNFAVDQESGLLSFYSKSVLLQQGNSDKRLKIERGDIYEFTPASDFYNVTKLGEVPTSTLPFKLPIDAEVRCLCKGSKYILRVEREDKITIFNMANGQEDKAILNKFFQEVGEPSKLNEKFEIVYFPLSNSLGGILPSNYFSISREKVNYFQTIQLDKSENILEISIYVRAGGRRQIIYEAGEPPKAEPQISFGYS